MPSSTDCWGIEVGAHAIKAMRLQKTGKDEIALADYELIPFKRVLTTPDLDVDEMIRVGLDQFLSRKQIGKATVIVSVPGHRAFARFAKLPPVEPKKVPDIVRFEAQQQIPFAIEEVEWDYQTFQHADSPDVEVGIFAITKDRVMNWLANFDAVGMPVHGLTLSPIAVYNAMAYDLQADQDTPGTILMDIGTSATDLIILEGGRTWLRTIPIGGHHFTEALVRSFKLSYTKAEKIKREAATSKYARQIFQAMRPVFVDLVSEVQKSLGYYQSLTRDADLTRLIGVGSTFRLPGLQKFLKQQLQINVSRLDKFERVDVEGRTASAFADQVLSMAPAYGLALQGLEAERVTCNILPADIVRHQLWKAKQPWAVAAAAVIALSASFAYGRLWTDVQNFQANETVRADIDRILNDGNSRSTQLSSISGTDPRHKIENLRRILDYRRVWPMILEDIHGAVAATDPQPELLSGDPERIRRIPRDQRRHVVIQRIEHEYSFGGAPGADPDQIWGERSFLGAPAAGDAATAEPAAAPAPTSSLPRGGMGTGTRSAAGTAGASQQQGAASPPSYTITVTGTTPMSRAHRFLNDTFVAYLEEKERAMADQDARYAEQPGRHPPRDRPYRIVGIEDLQVERVESDRRTGARDGQQPARQQLGGRGGDDQRRMQQMEQMQRMQEQMMQQMQRGGPGGYGPGGQPGAQPRARQQDQRRSVNRDHLAELMPSDPLAEEDRSGDWRFTIRYRVELVRPEEARLTDTIGGTREQFAPPPEGEEVRATPDDPADPLAEAQENTR